MDRRIINIDALSYINREHGDRFGASYGPAGVMLGSRQLGYNLTVVPPGKSPAPRHAHHANEEMLFVVSGSGKIQIGDQTHPLRAGDFVCLPAGKEHAHAVFNDSDTELRYIAVSTMVHPDVIEYPDSRKIGVITGAAPGRPHAERTLSHYAVLDAGVDYWHGE